jgi:hypothetical protein
VASWFIKANTVMEKVTGQDTGEATTANLMLPDESTVQVFCGGG